MTTKHTPGPWRVEKVFHDEMGRHDPVDFYVTAFDGRPLIARVTEQYRGVTEYNAALIAAAPDLLESLSEMLDCFVPEQGLLPVENEMSKKARAAICKARGLL